MARVLVIGGTLPEQCLCELASEHTVRKLTRNAIETEEGRSALQTAEGIIAIGQIPLGQDFFDRTPNLRVLSLRSVGYDRVDLDECARRRIVVCNTAGTLDRAVADLTVLLILSAARRLSEALAYRWSDGDAKPALGLDIGSKRVGLYGYGRIGSLVGKTLTAGFGTEVVYHSRTGSENNGHQFGRWVERDELFCTSDVVSVHTPLTPDTWHSIGTREFDLMKSSAYLVNTARGAVVDEAALINALSSRSIAGAALDVLETEPPSADNPLLTLGNVLVTPHIGSATEQTRHAMASRATANLLAVLAGRRPTSVVLDESHFATTTEGTR
ncbi:2-hydroxyacid dehydrogenase [Rhodococcus rhodochrous]|uniref:2-hydroxyacid dehydrogenase n=1 Tax=Rhodococcus rhodochrous TaxID=1829 RepID=UPI0006C84DBB|nr:NAD(P)-dependent oxidoreductase [Rhodococcus rhodochrous]